MFRVYGNNVFSMVFAESLVSSPGDRPKALQFPTFFMARSRTFGKLMFIVP